MTEEKRLYRSRDALVAGVCAGVADYFNVDPVVIRILTVVLTLASGGLLAIAYLALWVVLPKEPLRAPLDVEPQQVHSETYGAVPCDTARGKTDQSFNQAVSPATMASWRYASTQYSGVGHAPPEPPLGASREASQVPLERDVPYSGQTAGWSGVPTPPTPSSYVETPAPRPDTAPAGFRVRIALLLGTLLLFIGGSALVSFVVEGVQWWQCWPLLLAIVGIVIVVVPVQNERRMDEVSLGLAIFFLGMTLLPMSMGLLGWDLIWIMLAHLWPLLCIAAGLIVMGAAMSSPVLRLTAVLLFAVFCVAGVVWFSVSGAVEEIVLLAPYGREYHFLIVQ